MRTASQTKSQQSNAAGVLAIPPDQNRVAILLNAPAGRTLLIGMGTIATAALGLVVPSGVAPVILSYTQIGSAVQDAFVLTDSAGAQQTFTWVEIVLAP